MNEKTWVEISSQAFGSNIKTLKSILKRGVHFCAIVKSNAYGHDQDTIVRLASTEGIDHFGVDSVTEAIKLRKKLPNATIFILGYTPPERAGDIVVNNLIQTVYDEHFLEELSKAGSMLQKTAKVNLKVETGTQRQGIDIKKIDSFLREVRRKERSIELAGISSHFASSEDPNKDQFTEQQLRDFEKALFIAHDLGFDPEYQHIACSGAAITNKETHGTLTRFGISMYGLWGSNKLMRKNRTSKDAIDLKPVLSLKTKVAQIKDVPSGASIGYGCSFVTNHPIRIAVLPIGYYDGVRRGLSNKGEVLIHGQYCKILGTICMNMLMVDVSTIPNIKVGDTVTILGRDGMNTISAEEIAEKLGTINYEVTTQISPHLPRIVV